MKKGAFRFPMIKVEGGGGESPDPAVFCPTNGYEIPGTQPNPAIFCPINGYIPDPAAYIPDPLITEVILPPSGVIRLVVEDAGLRTILFNASVSNSGKYQATVIGADNTQLAQTTHNNNSTATITLPLEAGFLSASGYYYYYVDITSELPTNNLLTFRVNYSLTYDELGGYVIAAFINAPTLTSLANAFNAIKRIRYIEFLSESTSLTTLVSFAENATALRKLIFVSLPEVVLMIRMLFSTNYVSVNFPAIIPKLSSASYMCYNAKFGDFVFSFEAPLLMDLSQCFVDAEVYSITFTPTSFPELTTIYWFCRNSIGLRGTVKYPLMPKLTTMASAHENNATVQQIIFNGAMDSLLTWAYLANNCYALTKLVLPESVLGMTTLSTNAAGSGVVTNCNNLEELVLPKVFNITVGNTNGIFFNHFQGCVKLRTISMIEETNNLQCGLLNGSNLMALERFDQPNAFWTTNTVQTNFSKNAGLLGKLEYLEMDWDNWPKTAIYIERNNFNFTEVRRILARIDPLKSQTVHLFKMFSNPLIDYHCLADNTSWGANHEFTILKSNWNANAMKVGSSMFATQNNRFPTMFIKADDTFTLYTGWTKAPLNDTKIVFYTDTYSSYGMAPFKTFYVVNSQGTAGKVFQLSETLGGTPFAFNFGAELIDTYISFFASNNITSIVEEASNYRCTMTFPYYPNSGSRNGVWVNPDVFDWWELFEKGFYPM